MTSDAAAGHRCFLHATGSYGSDAEFLSLVVPFLQDGIASGEPTMAAFGPHKRQLLRAALPYADVTFTEDTEELARPAAVIRSYRDFFAAQVAAGAERIWLAGEVPHPGTGVPWDWWARYEGAANYAFSDFPMWGLCAYDRHTAPPDVLADAERTHAWLITADGEYLANPHFEDPADFLRSRDSNYADPLEGTAPAAELHAPSAGAARRAVAMAGTGCRLHPHDLHDLALGVSEAVGNAHQHGQPPVQLRIWVAADRIVATVTDSGSGPADPFAGLLPADRSTGGLGLWLMHQICSYVTMDRHMDGFTIRLIAGRPVLESPR
ncbi:sensor histidine kinase [Saccharomonospora sp. NPDC046836]|uniref:sensor histidine kinase n=1 Tax=Saccharomonospora sp. NPDC046836 TaxID=3156921 RepID=UPI0033F917A2